MMIIIGLIIHPILQTSFFTEFSNRFKSGYKPYQTISSPWIDPVISPDYNLQLTMVFTDDEIRAAFFDMSPYKAPG